MDGDRYGTTYEGGTNTCPVSGLPPGCGTIFKISPSGMLTTLHSFSGADGQYPSAGLLLATDSDLYGTTHIGGIAGKGTVFKITPSGTLTTLYSFCSQSGCTDGSYPYAGLVQATDENLYGTTEEGSSDECGFSYGCGTIFKITLTGALMTVYQFPNGEGNGPQAALIQATDGNLYGTTFNGGAYGAGAIFNITPSGTLTTLYSLCAPGECPQNGSNPFAALTQATNGVFYGTTTRSGAGYAGTVFSLSVGLAPFVEIQPTAGKVGTAVEILGTHIGGAASVTFNGKPALFTVISKSSITTMVPAGATTGTVQVVTPTGTLLSNVPFRLP